MTVKHNTLYGIGFCFMAFAGPIGCASTAPFVWVDDLPPAAMVPEAYRILPGDTLTVQVWNQQKMSGDVKVRSDGQVTLPLLGDVAVVNLTPSGAAQQIEHRLDGLVVDPKVTVAIKDSQPASYSMVGEIKNSGSFPLHPGVGLLQAIATAGGLTEFANPSKIYVIRKDTAANKRIRFTYDKLAHVEGRGVSFQLRDGDIVVVE